MMKQYQTGNIPPAIEQLFSGRKQSPLSADAFVRFQQIGTTPNISNNFYYVLMSDGRLFSAANSSASPADRQQRFNTPLPDKPTAILPMETIAEIEALLSAESFFSQPTYIADSSIRDGSLLIVTAQHDNRLHEVWYHNVSTNLTERLWSIQTETDSAETDLDDMLNDLQDRNRPSGQ
jgi:hypothetical protein